MTRGEKISKDQKEILREKYEVATRIMSSLQEAITTSGELNAAKIIEPLSSIILKKFTNKPTESLEPPHKKLKLADASHLNTFAQFMEKAFASLHPTIQPDLQLQWPMKVVQ
jgi:uncharacterized protein YjgD (DUF1641 family)